MTRAAIEAQALAPIADGIWRPQLVGERQAFVCQRIFTNGELGGASLSRETYGARLQGPDGLRFSPLYIFGEADAQAQCDQLNRKEQSNAEG